MGDFEGRGGENTTKSVPGSSHPAGSAMSAFFAAANQHAPVPVDPRVPGKKPDHAAAWPDEKDHLVSTDAQKIAEAHAIAEASVLAISLKQDTRDAKYRAVDTLDRVADPEMRKRMMVHYERITDEKLDASIEKSASFDKRDKEQALDLISTQRDAAYTKLAGLPPAEKASLEKNAETWASQVLAVTRPDDADEDGNARKIVNVLGPLEPYQIEAVRAAVRAQTGGKSIYQELDRSLSGSEGDAAVAALKGDPVFSGTIALATANGDLETVRDTLGWMSGEQIAEMKARGAKVGLDTDWIANSVPENHRAEVQALVDAKGTKANKNAAAEGERIAELFSDPREGLSITSIQDKQKLRDLETHAAPNILSELRDKSPEEIHAARAAWEKAHPVESWGALAERFRDGDANTYLRMQALMNGDKVGERAYALREAMRTHDQAGIEAALASPDLDNDKDAMKKAVAHAERLALMGRVRDLDARDRQLTAPLTGQSGGRTLDQQLADSYSDYVSSEPEIDDPSDALRVAASYKDEDTRRKQARNDQIATRQMLDNGELSTATKIHRARQAGDVKGESKLMQGIGGNEELRDVRLDYLATYDERMFRGLETDRFQLMANLVGDDDKGEIANRIALAGC